MTAEHARGGDILSRIVAGKRAAARGLPDFKTAMREARRVPPPMDFAAALREAAAGTGGGVGRFPVVAEIKRRSPSAGVLREGDFCPAEIAGRYADCGAACLSVLTDAEHFGGADSHLEEARTASGLPCLRKDFVADARQIPQSRILGADAILLIMAALPDDGEVLEFARAAEDLGMCVLAETHDEADLSRALRIPGALIGVNNRDLRTFDVSLDATFRLAPRAREAGLFVISESGIDSAESVSRLREHGADAFLIGGALMRSPDPGAALRALFES